MFARAAPEPADNNSCSPVPKEESGHPWPRQNRVTNATPQSKTSNISKCLLTRLKSYRYSLNHTHNTFPARKGLQSSSIPHWTSFVLFQIHELSQLGLHITTQSPWRGTEYATSTPRLRISILAISVSMTADANALFCIPWGRQISSKYWHSTTWQRAVSNSNKRVGLRPEDKEQRSVRMGGHKLNRVHSISWSLWKMLQRQYFGLHRIRELAYPCHTVYV